MINLDGKLIPCSLAWRLAIRREYRALRRRGYGPIGAHTTIVLEYDR
jgi:hypothetical protein